jgi:hypothetical protein
MELKYSWPIPGIPSFVIPQLPKIIHKLMRHSIAAGQQKVQLCTLLQDSMKLCGGSYSFSTAAVSYKMAML